MKLTKDYTDYADLLNQLKQKILSARQKSVLSVNRELIVLYWEIGREVLTRQAAEKWGGKGYCAALC